MLQHSPGFPRAHSLLTSEADRSGLGRASPAAGKPDVFSKPSSVAQQPDRLAAIEAALVRRPDIDVVTIQRNPGVPGSYGTWVAPLDPRLQQTLCERGIERPYLHQAEALQAIDRGDDVVLATSTASGKSLCYQVPIVSAVCADPRARALMLFPTKALARDQVRSLRELAGDTVGAAVYDGDTPPAQRRAARARAHAVATNPDMLHRGVLPHHDRWGDFLANLRYVVIDELHTYRGVFGSHVANILRRLWRVCRHHGSTPQVIACSATIANPEELAREVTGRNRWQVIDHNAAPAGPRTFVIVNPHVVDPITGVRGDYLKATRSVASLFRQAKVSTLTFCRTRKAVELLTRYLREDEAGVKPDSVGAGVDKAAVARAQTAVRGYRGGYLPERRREVERALVAGDARMVVTTHALELGIDIGGLDAVVLAGYPGTRAATAQRSGRAGRRASAALTVLVLSSRPLDQVVAADPDFLLGRPPEHARVDPLNPEILVPHLRCAAHELPLRSGEQVVGVPRDELQPALDYLADAGVLRREGEGESAMYFSIGSGFPADSVDIRGTLEENFTVVEVASGMAHNGRILAEVDFEDAPLYLHPGAIYAVEGRTYEVLRLDWNERKAYVRHASVTYYTEAMTETRVRVIEPLTDGFETPDHSGDDAGRHPHGTGHAELLRKVPGFKKLRFRSHENIGFGPVNLPDLELQTIAAHWRVPEAFLAEVDDPGARAAAELAENHVIHHCAAMVMMCDVSDLGCAIANAPYSGTWAKVVAGRPDATQLFEAAATPSIYLYDNFSGGAGLSTQIHSLGSAFFERALQVVEGCLCTAGCPTCLGASFGSGASFGGRSHLPQDVRRNVADLLRALCQQVVR